jgi:hypothetical protein
MDKREEWEKQLTEEMLSDFDHRFSGDVYIVWRREPPVQREILTERMRILLAIEPSVGGDRETPRQGDRP